MLNIVFLLAVVVHVVHVLPIVMLSIPAIKPICPFCFVSSSGSLIQSDCQSVYFTMMQVCIQEKALLFSFVLAHHVEQCRIFVLSLPSVIVAIVVVIDAAVAVATCFFLNHRSAIKIGLFESLVVRSGQEQEWRVKRE